MYCPSCSSENSKDQRFCRVCGLHLQTISQVVGHQLQSKRQIARNSEQNPTRIWQNPLLYGGFVFALGLTIIVIGKKVIGEQLVADMGTLMSVAGVALFIIKGIMMMQNVRGGPPPADEIPKADTTRELPHLLEAKERPSVTEFTTRNFDPVYAERHDPNNAASDRHSDS